ncbi:MAG TPA: hypothetical protein VJZ49_12420 [Syntrophales bacterium]|nr:hypothetical protein [Syntrophales bacterium]
MNWASVLLLETSRIAEKMMAGVLVAFAGKSLEHFAATSFKERLLKRC